MKCAIIVCTAALTLALASAASTAAGAQSNEVRIVTGFGLCFLPVYVAFEKKLIEKHAAAAGVSDVKVSHQRLSSGPAMNDALLSGSADIAMAGVSVMLNMWDKTVGRNTVKGALAICESPIYFNTIDPRIRSIRDFRDTDRIAMVAGRGTQHALVLEMATAQAFGWEQRHKFDALAVSMSHPDGVAALLSGGAVIKTHVTTVPFIQKELAHPGVRTILSSYDVAGGRHTLIAAYTTERWRNANPKLYQAAVAAMTEAIQIINSDKRAAAELFEREEPSAGRDVDATHRLLLDEDMMFFSATPRKVVVWADYMKRTGLMKNAMASWKDAFFENVHDAPGD
jgi:NitT/TauT family transport system substrate-binding protein